MRKVRWERMFPDELEAAFKECPLLYLTYGLCEPHGPQNTLGLDSLKAHGIACRAARRHGGIVAPPDYWHVHELSGYAVWGQRTCGEVDRTWLTSVPPWVHFKNVCYHIRAADALGFHAIILITGHYGPNWEDLKTLAELIQPFVGARIHGLPDSEANQPGFDRDGRSSGDHAGKVETSLLWAVEPDCVDMSRMPENRDEGPHFAMGPTAAETDRKTGERMVEDEIRWLGQKAKELLEEYDRAQSDQRLRTFEQVEKFWKQKMVPEIKNFKSMEPSWAIGEPVSEDSVWYPNSLIPNVPQA